MEAEDNPQPGAGEAEDNPQPGAGKAEGNPKPSPQPAKPHMIREIDFSDRRTAIICQEANGPCPLFAILNYLLLKGQISIPIRGEVSIQYLINVLADHITATPSTVEDMEKKLEDALANLRRLATGIDLNPSFNRIDGYQRTPELSIFSLLQIPLYHGWIVDPQDTELHAAIGSDYHDDLLDGVVGFKSGHNTGQSIEDAQLERALILSKADSSITSETSQSKSEVGMVFADQPHVVEASSLSVNDEEKKWELIENFINERYPDSITEHGICCLHEHVKENELCVLFRSKHYNIMFKYNGRLYLLENTEGFIDQTEEEVWRTLDQVKGAGVLVNSKFTLPKPERPRKKAHDYNALHYESTFVEEPSAKPIENMLITHHLAQMSLEFNTKLVGNLIERRLWKQLDVYLSQFVAENMGIPADEAAMMHPGLFMIPRREILEDLRLSSIEVAESFYQSSLEVLRRCDSKFTAFEIGSFLDQLRTKLKETKSVERDGADKIQTDVLDYIRVYFPSAINWHGQFEGIWQFAERMYNIGMDNQKDYNGFRCLVCGWDASKSYHANHLREHLLQSQSCKICFKVTPDVLDRLTDVDVPKMIECLKYIKVTDRSKRRKSASSASVSTGPSSASGHVESHIGKTAVDYLRTKLHVEPSASGSRGAKRSKSSPTTPTELQTGPKSFRSPITPTEVPAHTSGSSPGAARPSPGGAGALVKLSKVATEILDCLRENNVAGLDRISLTTSAGRLQSLCVQLQRYVWKHPGKPLPEGEFEKLLKASIAVLDHVEALQPSIAEEDVRVFLSDRAAVSQGLMMEIQIQQERIAELD